MEEMMLYKKGVDRERDDDFSKKKKYGDVYYHQKYLYTKKGFKWFYYPLDNIVSVEMIFGSRQLRQCCGAPIYQTKILLVTTQNHENLYLNVEETEHKDEKKTESLILAMKQNNNKIDYR